jgi:3-oxoacyl-[acyl-carrier protein] reductase
MTASTRFAGKVFIVTGGAGGIGSAIAESAAREGAKVGILDANPTAIAAAIDNFKKNNLTIDGHTVDIRDSKAVTTAVDAIAEKFGRVDVLIAAAGGSLGTPRDLDDIKDEDLDLVVDVNVKGTFYCAKAVIPHMKKNGGGAIVTFSSIGGRSASPVTGIPYAASKAAILGLTRRLAREVGAENIRVNAIAPGLFLTDRLQGMFDAMAEKERNEVLDSIPLHRMPKISECVEPVLFLASDAASYITGTVLDVNGGRLMPN